MRRWAWAIGALWLLFALVACGGTDAGSPPASGSVPVDELAKNREGYVDISVDQLAGMLENKDFTLVNVHVPYEGEIPQTDLFIPYDQIRDHLDKLPAQDARIVLYCRSGSMSTSAAQDLVDEGYTNVMELDGGFNAWEAQGYELLDRQ